MSQTKFMPITSRLLARKGDAVPSVVSATSWSIGGSAATPPPAASSAVPVDAFQAVVPPGPPNGGKPHRMTVLLTAREYENLGIAAVKKNVTRHQLVRTALDLHLERLQQELAGCACMTADDPCHEGCDSV